MNRLPPLTELRAFEAAARHRSFQRAAAELAVSPSAISHQIRLLEQNLGLALFRRGRRPIDLTDAGARLLPAITQGLALFRAGVASVRRHAGAGPLVVTTTNAFATRWLIPRLSNWRALYPHDALEVIGTDNVVDLNAGQAQVAVRYARQPPAGFEGFKLSEDRHWPAAVPGLLPAHASLAAGLRGQTLIHAHWDHDDAPTWWRWFDAARSRGHEVPAWHEMSHVMFHEEAHAIEAVVAGQGIALCSDVLVEREFRQQSIVRISDLSLPGYGFFVIHAADIGNDLKLVAFKQWIRNAAAT